MPRKPGLNSEFVMFDVVYEDGTLRSNRKVPRGLTGGIDGDKPAHGFLIEQDRDIAEKSGSLVRNFVQRVLAVTWSRSRTRSTKNCAGRFGNPATTSGLSPPELSMLIRSQIRP